MKKLRLATVWLDGCSGCHMSLVDIDERILDVAPHIELVYSPLMDAKVFPEHVDATLVEGAVSSEEDVEKAHIIRERSAIVISLGDCAVTGNVPAMRNGLSVDSLLNRAYLENVTTNPQIPTRVVPRLCAKARPLHEVVHVDLHIPGCPPSNDVIFGAIAALLEGRTPDLGGARFG
ncbi:MAG: NADP oxidoreductase [Kiritimatiellia bacterium]